MFMKLLISGAVAAVCEPFLGEGRSPYRESKDPCPPTTTPRRFGGDGRLGCAVHPPSRSFMRRHIYRAIQSCHPAPVLSCSTDALCSQAWRVAPSSACREEVALMPEALKRSTAVDRI